MRKFFDSENRPSSKIFVLTTSDSDRDIFEAYKFDVSRYLFKGNISEGLREALNEIDINWAIMP